MIKLLIGLKGSGKTKKLIDMAHEAVEASKGCVVCIEKGDTLTYDVDHKARLVNIKDYDIEGYNALYGFICGLCSGNYDITDILVDSTLKIGGTDLAELEAFIAKIAPVVENINLVLSASIEPSDVPEALKAYL